MTPDQDKEFSWTMFFLVSGFSLFLFAAVLAFLKDPFADYFVYGGITSLFAGIIAWIVDFRLSPETPRPVNRKQTRRR